MSVERRARLVQRRDVVGQRRRGATEPERQARDVVRPPVDLSRKTYLSVAEVMEYGSFSSANAVYIWAHRKRLPKCPGRGRTVLFLRRDVDEALQKGRNHDDSVSRPHHQR